MELFRIFVKYFHSTAVESSDGEENPQIQREWLYVTCPSSPTPRRLPKRNKVRCPVKNLPSNVHSTGIHTNSSRNAIDRWINTLRFIPATGHLQQLRGTKARFMTRGLTLKTEASHRRPPGEWLYLHEISTETDWQRQKTDNPLVGSWGKGGQGDHWCIQLSSWVTKFWS